MPSFLRLSGIRSLASTCRAVVVPRSRLINSELRGTQSSAVIVAGENCPAELAVEHDKAFPGVAFINEYGPTECSVWSTAHRYSPIGLVQGERPDRSAAAELPGLCAG